LIISNLTSGKDKNISKYFNKAFFYSKPNLKKILFTYNKFLVCLKIKIEERYALIFVFNRIEFGSYIKKQIVALISLDYKLELSGTVV